MIEWRTNYWIYPLNHINTSPWNFRQSPIEYEHLMLWGITDINVALQHWPTLLHIFNIIPFIHIILTHQGMSCFRNHECQSPFIYLDVIYTTDLMEEYSRCCDENMYPSQKMGQTLYIWCLCDTLNLPVRLLFSLDLHRSVDSWI